jgi:hypothetical protein
VVKFEDFQTEAFASPRSTAPPPVFSKVMEPALVHLVIAPGANDPANAELARQKDATATSSTTASFFIVNPPLP